MKAHCVTCKSETCISTLNSRGVCYQCTVKGKVYGSRKTHDVVSLAEALRRRGFPLTHILCESEWTKNQAEEILVGFDPTSTALLNDNSQGECFVKCSGDMLFSFGRVSPYNKGAGRDDHYFYIQGGYGIVADIITTEHNGYKSQRIVYKLVQSA